MKKIFKCLLFMYPIYLSGEFCAIHDADRKAVKKCMESALTMGLSEKNDYQWRLAQRLIQDDLKEEAEYGNKVFSFSVYDKIYFEVLSSINDYYLSLAKNYPEYQKMIHKKKSIESFNAVTNYYLNLAKNLLRYNVKDCIECAYSKVLKEPGKVEQKVRELLYRSLKYINDKGDNDRYVVALYAKLKSKFLDDIFQEYLDGGYLKTVCGAELMQEECVGAILAYYYDEANRNIYTESQKIDEENIKERRALIIYEK